MIIGDDPKFICFQPWKCGSTTLYRRLKRFDVSPYAQVEYYNETLGEVSSKHKDIDDFLRLPEARYRRPRFVFVRNPYDRFYSGFLQRSFRLRHDPPKRRSPEAIAAELAIIDGGFAPFLDHFLETRSDRISLVAHAFDGDGRPAVDYVGFVETFEASFAQICDRIGIPVANRASANVRYEAIDEAREATRENARYRYIEHYDAGTLAAVNRACGPDFAAFGYRMLGENDLDAYGRVPSSLSPFADGDPAELDGSVLRYDRAAG